MKFIWLSFLLILSLTSSLIAQESLPDLVRRIKPSAVAIETFNARGEKLARGSGFFIATNRVVTNRHVIEGAYKAEIHLSNGNTYPVKGVLAVDGEGDIALLQVEVPASLVNPLMVVRTSPQEGEGIVVIGNPFGFEGSVSNGIVSAVRDIPNYGRIIQITAPISPGSSGSPVVNMSGQLVGVATLQLTDGQSLNFAVPSERVAQLQAGTLTSFSDLVVSSRRNKRAAAEHFYAQGLGFLSHDDWAKALPLFERAVDTDPDYAEAWYQSSYCNGMLGRHNEALRASRQVIRLRPDWPEPYVNMGHAYSRLAQYQDAINAYKQALRLDPYNADVHYAMGVTYGKWNKPDDEILSYRKAINLSPDHAGAYERLGLAYFRLGRFKEAAGAFNQLRMLKPGEAKASNYLGETYLKLNRVEEGIEAFKQATRLKPDFGTAYYNLALGYLALGDREAALVQYNILKAIDADLADKLFSLINP
ncbi:MAG TPA: tetratricopeptide repeat protein [Pyrinomonadaceae bacterium]|jgi:tetratricopeptide (TPR) repeat protein